MLAWSSGWSRTELADVIIADDASVPPEADQPEQLLTKWEPTTCTQRTCTQRNDTQKVVAHHVAALGAPSACWCKCEAS